MERYRDRKIPIEKFLLSISVSAYHHCLAFPRMDKWLGIALKNSVKDLVCKGCLKFLAIEHRKGFWEIDAPNLVSLRYEGDQIPELKIAKESGQLKNSRIGLHSLKNLNAAWFGELKKFLSYSTSWSLVSLRFELCNEINRKDLELHHTVATPEVEILSSIYRVTRQIPEACGCFAMELSSLETLPKINYCNDYLFHGSFNVYEEFKSFYFSWKQASA
ncbi:hypothetical protein HAX54_019294 [Datura stramonium]|uniref:Uncharacterized protein n=1 Tax=Datura stramonium TaxID=4076 RepID=A0ABS8UR52_DATST|nr:hypothetical protein [Datura stramonium]